MEVTGDATVDYEENGTGAVATYTSSVADATWSLSGEDMDDFSISSGGVLEFTSPPDYEAPTDANTDNVYMVTVMAMAADADDGSLEVAVTVTDMDEETPPTVTVRSTPCPTTPTIAEQSTGLRSSRQSDTTLTTRSPGTGDRVIRAYFDS